jgi:hypothetical protein
MVAIASMRQSDREMTCAKCGDALIAPEWSEFLSGRRVFNFWSCTKCGSCLGEISASLPADVESIDDIVTREDVFPTLLVV